MLPWQPLFMAYLLQELIKNLWKRKNKIAAGLILN